MITRASLLMAIVLGTMWLCLASPAPRGGSEAGVLMSLPPKVGLLLGVPKKPDAIELKLLPTDTEFAKMTYVTASNDILERDIAHVSIVLSGAESRSIHRPEVCLTGQGWSIVGSQVIPVQVAPGRTLWVRDLTLAGEFPQADGKSTRLRTHYVYWFVGSDFNTPSHFDRLWHSTCDAVFRNVNHRWAYVSIMATVTEGLDPKVSGERQRSDVQTQRLITYLIQQLVPQFQKDYLSQPAA